MLNTHLKETQKQKLNAHLPYILTTSLLDIYPKERKAYDHTKDLYNILSSFMSNHSKLEIGPLAWGCEELHESTPQWNNHNGDNYLQNHLKTLEAVLRIYNKWSKICIIKSTKCQ